MGGQGASSPLSPSLDNSGKTPLNQRLKYRKGKVGGVKIFKDREKEHIFRKTRSIAVSFKQNKISVGTVISKYAIQIEPGGSLLLNIMYT